MARSIDDDVAALVADLADPDVRRAVGAVLDRAGSVAAFVTELRRGLGERTRSYGDLLAQARVGSLTGGLRGDVEAHFGPLIDLRERERRKAQWLARFQEESDRAIEDGRVGPAGLWPWAMDSDVVREACAEDPAMAADLGWFCADVHDSVLLCIIRPLVCVIVIIVIATEGAAH